MTSRAGKQAGAVTSVVEPRLRAGSGVWICSVLLYLYVAAIFAPVLGYGALSLDDASMLRHGAAEPWSAIFGYDPFGHLRPGKNALFAVLAAHPEAAWLVRLLIVAAHLFCIASLQLATTRLMDSRWWGLLGAAMFALNPTTASAVAWLSASSYVLCLALLWLHVLAGHAALDRKRRSEPWKTYAFASTLAALLAGFQHELGLLAPLVFLATRRASARNDEPVERATLAIAAGGSLLAGLVMLVLRSTAAKPEVAYRMAEHGAGALVQHAGRYFVENVRLWLWQGGAFGVLRDDAPAGFPAQVYAGWLALLGTLIAAVWLVRRDRLSTFGFAWLAFLLPVINVVPLGTTPVAMHYLYLPGVGLAFLAVRAGHQLARLLDRRVPVLRATPAASALILALAWQPELVTAVKRWASDVSLYEASLASHPGQVEVRANLAAAYLREDRLTDAEALLAESLALSPRDPVLVKNQFELLRQTGKAQQALAWLNAHPDLLGAELLYRKAQLQEYLGQRSDAVETYARAAATTANEEERFWASLHHARLLLQTGRTDEGLKALGELVERYPDRPELDVLTGRRTTKPAP